MRKRQLLGLVSAFALSQFAGGQVTTWTNQSGDNSWANPANWNNGVPTASGEALVALAGAQIDLGGATQSVGLLRFSSAGGAALNTGTLLANEILSLGATSTLSVNTDVTAGGPELALRSNTAGVLRFNGNIDDAAGMSSDLRLVNALLFGATRASGAVHVNAAASTLSNGAAFVNPSSINVNGGRLVLVDSINAIPDTVPIHLSGGGLSAGALASDFVERVGTISLLRGSNNIGLGTGSLNPRTASISAPALMRDDLATLIVSSAQVVDSRIKFDQPIANFGGGSLATQRPMLPWALASSVGPGLQYAFTTYDAGVNPIDPDDDIGFRPLDLATEHRNGFAGATLFDNVRITAATTVNTPTEIQSLSISSPVQASGVPTISLTLNAPLTIRSGGILGTGTFVSGIRFNQIAGSGSITVPGDAFISEFVPTGAHEMRIQVPLHADRIVVRGNGGVRLSDARAQKIVVQGASTSFTLNIDSTTADEIEVLVGGVGIFRNFSGAVVLRNGARFGISPVAGTFSGSVHFEPRSADEALLNSSRFGISVASTMTGPITGAGSFQSGRWRHFGNATFEYADILNEDAFELNGTWRATDGDLVMNQIDTVNFVAALSGTGTFLGDIFGGGLAPGQGGAGRLTINSFSARGLYSQMTFELNGLEPSSGYDQLRILDAISLEEGAMRAPAFRLQLQFTPPMGSEFMLIDNQGPDPIRGRFLNLPEGTLFDAAGIATLAVTYFGGDGNDFVLTVVPEPLAVLPMTLWLLPRRRRCRSC